jgi:hypothetical protein
MANPRRFPRFTCLPSELRLRIWELSIPEARVVPVRFHRRFNQYVSDAAPPALLHVCSETRTLFLSTHTKLILSPKYDSAVFVNFAIDTIFFDSLDCSPEGDLSLDLARSPHRTRILSCAIETQVWEILRVFKYDPLSEVRMMPKLKTMALVMMRDHDGGERERRHIDRYGSHNFTVRVNSTTVESGLINVQGWVDTLRNDLRQPLNRLWAGNIPTVQMWLW